jgi:hypothetical protein
MINSPGKFEAMEFAANEVEWRSTVSTTVRCGICRERPAALVSCDSRPDPRVI